MASFTTHTWQHPRRLSSPGLQPRAGRAHTRPQRGAAQPLQTRPVHGQDTPAVYELIRIAVRHGPPT
eukprot:4060562-Alexandrium_andersonii.AAC.1